MTKEEKDKLFWQQYHGTVRAIDLPMEYKISDKRIRCCNKDCFHLKRDKCLFWHRFMETAKIMRYSKKYVSWHIRNVKEDQSGKRNRESWDKYYPMPHYYSASFDFYPEQEGLKCEYYVDVNELNNHEKI